MQDLAGLGKVGEKFLDVIAKGLGKFYEPYHVKRMAEAKAFECTTISEAIKNHQQIGEVLYKDQALTITSLAEQSNNPVLLRLAHQETNRQNNLDRITQVAAIELSTTTEVSEEAVDEDWISRFFNISQDVSNQEMQLIWGKILAGEIKQPKSFSLRTLELLKNITAKEAKIFEKLASVSIVAEDGGFILNNIPYYESNFNIKVSDYFFLSEIGLLQFIEGVAIKIQKLPSTEYEFHNGTLYFSNSGNSNEEQSQIEIYKITKPAHELIQLIDVSDKPYYVKWVSSEFQKAGAKVTYKFPQ